MSKYSYLRGKGTDIRLEFFHQNRISISYIKSMNSNKVKAFAINILRNSFLNKEASNSQKYTIIKQTLTSLIRSNHLTEPTEQNRTERNRTEQMVLALD